MQSSTLRLKNKRKRLWRKTKMNVNEYQPFITDIQNSNILSYNTINILFNSFHNLSSYFFKRIFIHQFNSLSELNLYMNFNYNIEDYISRIWLYSFNITKKIHIHNKNKEYLSLFIDKMIYLIFRKFKSIIFRKLNTIKSPPTLMNCENNITTNYSLIDLNKFNVIKPNYYQQWLLHEINNSSIYTDLYNKIPIYKKKYCTYIKEKECQIVN